MRREVRLGHGGRWHLPAHTHEPAQPCGVMVFLGVFVRRTRNCAVVQSVRCMCVGSDGLRGCETEVFVRELVVDFKKAKWRLSVTKRRVYKPDRTAVMMSCVKARLEEAVRKLSATRLSILVAAKHGLQVDFHAGVCMMRRARGAGPRHAARVGTNPNRIVKVTKRSAARPCQIISH